MQITKSSITIVAQQLSLCPPLPSVRGSVEFTEFCARWNRIDSLLRAGLELEYVTKCLHHKHRKRPMTFSEQATYQLESQRALRCSIARSLLSESLREFSCHLAESPVLQNFCLFADLSVVSIPGHSQLQRYERWLPAEDIHAIVINMLKQTYGVDAPLTLGLEQPVSFDTVWVDSTCAETNIHYPVDWVLLRDAVRTIIEAIKVLRSHGMKYRMPKPQTFITKMNQLCIKMTHVGKGAKRKTRQKDILRNMTGLVKTVQAHAERYIALVAEQTTFNGWAVAAQRRMNSILDQLPAVLHQAHERIIGERQVATQNKILSLYEPDTAVLTRGKSGAQVEFGYSLFVVEQRDGLIVDWELSQKPQTDQALLHDGIARWQSTYGAEVIRTVVTDRGFDGPSSRADLASAKIENCMCPRSPKQLIERLNNPNFRALQRRRAQTEGRIGIVKQTFLGGHLQTKGYAHQQAEVAWVMLAHNLWVLARLPETSKQMLAA